MANRQEAINAAKKIPSARSTSEQALVDRNDSDQQVRNADHAAKREEKIYGKR